MLKIFVISVLSFMLAVIPKQPEINYKHKKLYKELEKTWGLESPELEEMIIPDSVLKQDYIQGKFFRVTKNNVSQHYIYIGRVNSCRAGGCSITSDLDLSTEMEYFDYYILFDVSKVVQQVRIFNYQATHGQEVSAKGWLKQFTGYNGVDTLEVGKNVDAITGATISVYGITEDVQLKTLLLGKLI